MTHMYITARTANMRTITSHHPLADVDQRAASIIDRLPGAAVDGDALPGDHLGQG